MGKTLLLVEDNVTMQTLITDAFTSAGFEVIVASHAAEGLQHLQTIVPDIVLADAAMPETDGFQLCQIIRNTAHVTHVPVVLLTSKYAVYDQAKGHRVGVTAHLDKPFALPVIVDLVRRLVLPSAGPQGPHTAASLSDRVTTPERAVAGGTSLTSVAPRRDGIVVGTQEMERDAPAAALEQQRLETWERDLLQTLQQTFEARLTHMLEQLTPQLLDLTREVVTTKVSALLEVLLQREIDKLKQALADEERMGQEHRIA